MLSGMFSSSVQEAALTQARLIEIERLKDNPYQPRTYMDRAGLNELAQVIKAQGFQGVLVARPHPQLNSNYQLTAGHRRREAAKIAGLLNIPIVVLELADEEMASIAITENIQREDLTPLEEGKIFLLMSEEMAFTHEQIAREVGKNRGYVENRLRVARAPQDIHVLVKEKPDSLRAVSTLIKLEDAGKRADVIQQLLSGHLTADDLPAYIANLSASLPIVAGFQTPKGNEEKEKDTINSSSSQNQDNKGDIDYPALQTKESGGGINPAQTKSDNFLNAEVVSGEGLTAAETAQHTDERTRTRVANTKLTTALRTLTTYRDGLTERLTPPSQQEQANFSKLLELVNELKAYYKT